METLRPSIWALAAHEHAEGWTETRDVQGNSVDGIINLMLELGSRNSALMNQIDSGTIQARRKVFRGGVEMGTKEELKICIYWGYLVSS